MQCWKQVLAAPAGRLDGSCSWPPMPESKLERLPSRQTRAVPDAMRAQGPDGNKETARELSEPVSFHVGDTSFSVLPSPSYLFLRPRQGRARRPQSVIVNGVLLGAWDLRPSRDVGDVTCLV